LATGPSQEPPEVITVTPGRGQANAVAMLGAFQVVGCFVNYINDKLQGERAQQALRQAASEITKWQATTRGDGALISISYVRKGLQ
jgi:hypothetical protein